MSGPGQPTKVSRPLAMRIAKMVRKGVPVADAAEQCGIDRSSYFNWMKRGEAGEAPYSEFSTIIHAAVVDGRKKKQSG